MWNPYEQEKNYEQRNKALEHIMRYAHLDQKPIKLNQQTWPLWRKWFSKYKNSRLKQSSLYEKSLNSCPEKG
jgi:hypothetical protein